MAEKTEKTEIAKNARDAYKQVADYLFSKSKMLQGIAPKYMDTELMIRLALGATSRNARLLQCTPQSWLMALMDAAYYGIEPNVALGHAYLIPYQNKKIAGSPYEVQFMIGYKGLVLLACESGGFEDVEARTVYVGEIESGRFEETPEDPRVAFRHRPLYQPESRGAVAGYYAIGWRGPEKRARFRYLTVEEVEGYRARSRAANDGPWKTDYDAMAQKTAVRRMLAMAQMRPGSKLGTLLNQESASDRGEIIRAQDWQVESGARGELGATRTDDLAEQLAKRAGHAPEPVTRAQPRAEDQEDGFEGQGDFFGS